MTTEIRPPAPRDAQTCDEIIASLPHHVGQEEGRRECAAAGRAQSGLVAERDGEIVGLANGFELPRHFGGYWSGGDTPVLMIRVLG
jgi:hypothetical protein